MIVKGKVPVIVFRIVFFVAFACLLVSPVLARSNTVVIVCKLANHRLPEGDRILVSNHEGFGAPADGDIPDLLNQEFTCDDKGRVIIDTSIETRYAPGTTWYVVQPRPDGHTYEAIAKFTVNDKGSAHVIAEFIPW